VPDIGTKSGALLDDYQTRLIYSQGKFNWKCQSNQSSLTPLILRTIKRLWKELMPKSEYFFCIKWLLIFTSLCLCCPCGVLADTIYQWTDPWGQVKYSKTQVQGSMISELTELPESQVSSEQQKQEAMLNKMQVIKKDNDYYQQKKHTDKALKQQRIIKEKHCQTLRNTLAELKLNNTRRYYTGNYYYPGQELYPARNYYGRYGYYRDNNYNVLKNDLYKEIRKYCR